MVLRCNPRESLWNMPNGLKASQFLTIFFGSPLLLCFGPYPMISGNSWVNGHSSRSLSAKSICLVKYVEIIRETTARSIALWIHLCIDQTRSEVVGVVLFLLLR